jgi:hypothetical protein
MGPDDLLEPGERINSAKEFKTRFDGSRLELHEAAQSSLQSKSAWSSQPLFDVNDWGPCGLTKLSRLAFTTRRELSAERRELPPGLATVNLPIAKGVRAL